MMETEMVDLPSFPDDHRRRGRYDERLSDGTRVTLEISERSRPIRGNELVKASMSMQMGRPTSFNVSEQTVALMIGNRGRLDIEVLPNGSYRHGRLLERSLRELAQVVVSHYRPQSKTDPSGHPEDDAAPGFTR